MKVNKTNIDNIEVIKDEVGRIIKLLLKCGKFIEEYPIKYDKNGNVMRIGAEWMSFGGDLYIDESKSFSSELIMECYTDRTSGVSILSSMNNLDFNIIDDILYVMVGQYWNGDNRGKQIQLIDLNSNSLVYYKEYTDMPEILLPANLPSCCVYNDELYYLSDYRDDTEQSYHYILNSCKYNKDTKELEMKQIKEVEYLNSDTKEFYKLLYIENDLFVVYTKIDNTLNIFNIETNENMSISGILKENESTQIDLVDVNCVDNRIYVSIAENYTYKSLGRYVYYFDYTSGQTSFTANLLKKFNGEYTSFSGASTEGEYVSKLFIQYDFINKNPVALAEVYDTNTSTKCSKIYNLSNDTWYKEIGTDYYNLSSMNYSSNVIDYNNELYIIDYNTGLHKITFKK